MNALLKKVLSSGGTFFGKKKTRRLSFLILVCLLALGDFLFSGLVRRTFVFYSFIGREIVVEDRILHRSSDRETDIRRYVEEVLLGPVSPDLAPLFPLDTRLNSIMYRDGLVYVDLSESAALPVEGMEVISAPLLGEASTPPEGEVFRSLLTLNEGIRRNFRFVKDVRLFIGGNEVFFNEFNGIFAISADNSKTSM